MLSSCIFARSPEPFSRAAEGRMNSCKSATREREGTVADGRKIVRRSEAHPPIGHTILKSIDSTIRRIQVGLFDRDDPSVTAECEDHSTIDPKGVPRADDVLPQATGHDHGSGRAIEFGRTRQLRLTRGAAAQVHQRYDEDQTNSQGVPVSSMLRYQRRLDLLA